MCLDPSAPESHSLRPCPVCHCVLLRPLVEGEHSPRCQGEETACLWGRGRGSALGGAGVWGGGGTLLWGFTDSTYSSAAVVPHQSLQQCSDPGDRTALGEGEPWLSPDRDFLVACLEVKYLRNGTYVICFTIWLCANRRNLEFSLNSCLQG